MLPRGMRGTARTEALFSISVVGLLVCGACAFLSEGASSSPEPKLAPERSELAICADPDDLPFSNERLEGYENRLGRLVAEEIGMKPHFTFWPDGRGFFKNTLKSGHCDLVVSVPSGSEGIFTTRPYLESLRGPMSMGVRSKDRALGEAIDRALEKRRADIEALLEDAGVLPDKATE